MQQGGSSANTGILKFSDLKEDIEVLVKSGSLPKDCSTPEAAYMKMAYGRELGFTPVQSLHLLTMIQGTQTVNAKGVSRLFALHNYTFRLIHNADYIYAGNGKTHYSGRKLTSPEIVAALGLTPEEFRTLDADPEKNKLKQGILTSPKDRITKIEYGIKHSHKVEWLGFHEYYWSDVEMAKLHEKDTYKFYPKTMMLHRCKVELSKLLGILTAPETEEMAMVHNIDSNVVDGEVTIIE